MDTLNRALALYQTDNPSASFGVASTTYLSFPDTTNPTSTCTGLGIPSSTAPSGWNNLCTASSTFRAVNGNGWIPVTFSTISSGSPLAQLPVDPVNSTSTNYRYVGGTGAWAVSAMLESQKMLSQQAAQDGGYDPGRYEKGSNLGLVAQSEGLLGWWTFDEGNGTTTNDSSGNGNTGAANSPTYVAGKVGPYAISFDGVNTYVNVGNVGALAFSNTASITAWVKFTVSSGNAAIVEKMDDTTNEGYSFLTSNIGVSGVIRWLSYTNATTKIFDIYSPLGYNDGNWHFVAGTYDRANATIYVDGSQTKMVAATSSMITNSQPFVIGAQSNFAAKFNGTIDDVRVFNRSLTAAEIAAIYNAQK